MQSATAYSIWQCPVCSESHQLALLTTVLRSFAICQAIEGMGNLTAAREINPQQHLPLDQSNRELNSLMVLCALTHLIYVCNLRYVIHVLHSILPEVSNPT